MAEKYEFTPDMREISGFGGGYESCCRRMFKAACEWLDAHPEADPKRGNADARALQDAAAAAAGECGPSGAQVAAACGNALSVRMIGWPAYVAKKTHPRGRIGILEDALAEKTKDYHRICRRFDELERSNRRRGHIIAEQVLGWRRYPTSNGIQTAYASCQADAEQKIRAGDDLDKLVDMAIDRMPVASDEAEPKGGA